MQTIEALWKNGVFTPNGSVDLAEGTKVTLQLDEAPTHSPKGRVEYQAATDSISASPFLEDEATSAPFDLPAPEGARVVAATKPIPLPDSHDIGQ